MLIARSVHPQPGEAERKERLLGLVGGFSSRRVRGVGDLIADEFVYGEIARVSREAPVLILKYDSTEMVGGGAANAANNVAAPGGRGPRGGRVGGAAERRQPPQPAGAAAPASPRSSVRIRKASGCSPASIAASTDRRSCAPEGIE